MLAFRKKLGYEKSTADLFGKPKPKKFNYSSEMNSMVLEQALSDTAAVRECTVSDVIEDILIDNLIPADPHAAHYVTKVLFGKRFDFAGNTKKYGIREALDEIFAAEAAGVLGQARHANNQPLVQYAKSILAENRAVVKRSFFDNTCKGDNPSYHMLDSWDSVCNKLEAEVERRKSEGLGVFDYQQAADYARAIEQSLRNDPSFSLATAFDCVLENWEIVGNYTYTFRFLSSAIASSVDWTDSPEERFEFAAVCQKVMSGWTAADKAREDAREKARQDAILTSYDMAGGDTISVPRGWLVANPEDAPTSKYAGVIEVKNGERYNAPHILFYSSTPVDSAFTDEQRAKVLVAATSVWPRLSEVQGDEVELEYGPDGGVLNMQEYTTAPKIGMFQIYDKGRYPLGKPPYGACITRAGEEAW